MSRVFWLPTFLIAFCAGSAGAADSWHIETLDQTGVGRYSSMRFDKDGNGHVVYVVDNGETYPVKYGFWDHQLKRWFVMTVGAGGSICSLTLDSQQRPHIAYVDWGTMPGAKLHYGRWDGTAWQMQAVPLQAEIVAYYTSIALDAQDRPSISFYEYTGPRGSDFRVRMRVVKWNGQVWEVETVDGDNQSGKFNALAIDAQDRAHLAYANVNAMTAGMRYAYWDGKSWKVEVLEGLPTAQTYIGFSVCLALDKNGNPHVSYSTYSAPYLVKYAVRREGRWQIEVVDQIVKVGYPDRNGIFVTDTGQPYISYFDFGQGTLKLAHRQGQKWVAETVDGNGAGFTSSVQIDHDVIWICYADEGNGGFKIAHRTLGASDSTSSGKSLETTQLKK